MAKLAKECLCYNCSGFVKFGKIIERNQSFVCSFCGLKPQFICPICGYMSYVWRVKNKICLDCYRAGESGVVSKKTELVFLTEN